VALGVYFSVSATSITSLYVAIKSNVDVESLLQTSTWVDSLARNMLHNLRLLYPLMGL
jgi:hypothetical protein